jgi:hypothetical protein
MHSRFERFLPAGGILGATVFAVRLGVMADEPAIGDGVNRHIAWYADHQAAAGVSLTACLFFSVLTLMFAAALRSRLRSAEASEASYSSVAFAGAILMAAGVAGMGALDAAVADAVDHDVPQAVAALGWLSDFSWLPWAAGAAAMLLATGLGGLRTLALPRALSIATVALGALCMTPVGRVTFYALPLWLAVTAVVLARDQRQPRTVVSVAPAPIS